MDIFSQVSVSYAARAISVDFKLVIDHTILVFDSFFKTLIFKQIKRVTSLTRSLNMLLVTYVVPMGFVH